MKKDSNTNMKSQLISQGAEAVIRLENKIITKDRIQKSYRLKELDENLRKKRTKSESKILEKTSQIINTPKVIKTEKFQIQMQYIEGERLSETLNEKPRKTQIEIIQEIAEQVAKLHDNNIIHSDLTTSNTILTSKNNNQIKPRASINNKKLNNNQTNEVCLISSKEQPIIYIIDFGLSFISKRIEDKAVDIHLIKQALEAKHYQTWEKLYEEFIKAYNPIEKTKILERLKKVESRGRYKHSCE